LTILSVVTINWILNYRKKAHIVQFALDGSLSLSAIVFDVDGLMIDSERGERTAWQAAAEEFGCAISDAEFATIIGVSHSAARDILTQAWSGKSNNACDFDKIFARKLELASRVPIEKKPGLESLMCWAESLSIPIPRACLVLEDSDNGVRAANAAGTIPVLIPDMALRAGSAPPLTLRPWRTHNLDLCRKSKIICVRRSGRGTARSPNEIGSALGVLAVGLSIRGGSS
jgi:beta-phosphoglucomutase-like phosphatase (HAD superfamily)